MRQFYSHEVTDVHFHSFLCFQLMTTVYFESNVIIQSSKHTQSINCKTNAG